MFIGNPSSQVLSDSLSSKKKKKKMISYRMIPAAKSRSKVNASTVIKASPWSYFTESDHAILVSDFASKVSWKC
jgi:hypothetical protein